MKRVYGIPIERDRLTIIPAASVWRGWWRRPGEHRGAGYGVRARPVGAFAIKDGEVRWLPAVDETRIALRGMLVPIVGMLVARSIARTLAKRR